MASPRAEHVPADDGRELHRPDEAGREEIANRFVEGSIEQVPSELERVGDRDEDPLAIDEQVREVVGHEVPDGDREQARPGRRPANDAPHRERRAVHEHGAVRG